MVQSVQIIVHLPKMTRVDNPTISFIENDARRLYHSHDNALVISLSIADFNTRWVLVDNGSLANQGPLALILPMTIGTGSITLLVTIGTYP